MTVAPNRFPLAWPAHRPRKRAHDRQRGTFEADKKAITLGAAVDKLEDQIERLGGRYPVLSSNLEIKMDGRPRADRGAPADPGVCVYFELKGRPLAMACDAYTTVQMNVAAIANHIDAVRRQERYGVASAEESLQAFAALPAPAPSTLPLGARDCWTALGLKRSDVERIATVDARKAVIQTAFRARASDAHPDTGGSTAAMAELTAARDQALSLTGA